MAASSSPFASNSSSDALNSFRPPEEKVIISSDVGSEDVPQLANLQHRAWQTAYRGLLPDDLLDEHITETRLRQKWEELLAEIKRAPVGHARQRLFVARLGPRGGEAIIGYCLHGPARSEAEYRSPTALDREDIVSSARSSNDICWELHSLYVDPEYQRQGFGVRLWRHLIHAVVCGGRRAEKLVVWVGKPNMPARRFYEKQGGALVEGVLGNRKSIWGWEGGLVCYEWSPLDDFEVLVERRSCSN